MFGKSVLQTIANSPMKIANRSWMGRVAIFFANGDGEVGRKAGENFHRETASGMDDVGRMREPRKGQVRLWSANGRYLKRLRRQIARWRDCVAVEAHRATPQGPTRVRPDAEKSG